MPERDYNYTIPRTYQPGSIPDFTFEPRVLKVITMDDWSEEAMYPLDMSLTYDVELTVLARDRRSDPDAPWLLLFPENKRSTKDLLKLVHGFREGIIVTNSLYVLRELDLLDPPNIRYYNLNKGVWRVSRDIDLVGDIEILEREIEQSQRYLDAASGVHKQAISSLALADTGVTAEIPTVFRDSLPGSIRSR